MSVGDVIIYESDTSMDELEYRLHVCIDYICNRYSMNNLWIDKNNSNVIVIGDTCCLKSLNLDGFTIAVDSDKLLLARTAKF